MAIKFTDAQKQAIKAQGTNLVSAAAGSGKTAVLVERVVQMLLNETAPIDADQLLIVTFTNAAAAEMRDRIDKRLTEEAKAHPENQRIHTQLLLLNNAQITTIDAFCIQLCREYFTELGITPDFQIAAEDTLTPVSETVLKSVLTAEYQKNEPVFYALLHALGAEYDDRPLSEAILKIQEYSASMPFPAQWRRSWLENYHFQGAYSENPWVQVLLRKAQSDFDYLRGLCCRLLQKADASDYLQDKYRTPLQTVYQSLTQCFELAVQQDWDALAAQIPTVIIPALPRTKNSPETADFKIALDNFKNVLKGSVEKLVMYFSGEAEVTRAGVTRLFPLFEKLLELVDLYEQERFTALLERNTLAFPDCERLALSLLANEDGTPKTTQAASAIRSTFAEVLVDEYQDTNQLQDTLFRHLAGESYLFMVGDVKQSIYRFRHADPTGFISKMEQYASGEDPEGHIIYLSQNFRSRAGICEFVNHCFSHLMSKESAEMVYDEMDNLQPGAIFPPNDGEDVRLVFLEAKREDKKDALDAAYVVQYIQEWMAAGPFLRDAQHPGTLRPASYSDFTVLLRSFSSHVGAYVEALQNAGIPVTAGADALLEARECVTFFSLLDVISNPDSDVPLMSYMLSSLGGFTTEEAANLHLLDQKSSLYANLLLAQSQGDKKVDTFLNNLSRYRQEAITRPLSDFMLWLLEDTGYLDAVMVLSDGVRRRSNLLLLVDYAVGMETNEAVSISGYLYRMRRANAKKAFVGAPPTSDGSDAVKIMTVHASKGLQFPICIIAGCGTSFNRANSIESMLVNDTVGFGARIWSQEEHRKLSNLARDAISVQNHDVEIAESIRLLYVAMTRAEEKLLLVTTTGKPEAKYQAEMFYAADLASEAFPGSKVLAAGSVGDWLFSCAATHPAPLWNTESADAIRCVDGVSLRLVSRVPEEEFQHAETRLEASQWGQLDLTPLQEIFSYRYPYAPLHDIIAKSGVSRLAEDISDVDYSCTAVPAFLSGQTMTPAQRGTLSHRFLELADFQVSDFNFERQLMLLQAAGAFTEAEGNALFRQGIVSFFESSIYQRIQQAKWFRRELRFLHEVPASAFDPTLPSAVAEEPVILQGVADCIFAEGDGLVILDYKTDRVSEMGELQQRYAPQLRIYAKAAEKMFQIPVKSCVIYSLRLCEFLEFSADSPLTEFH